MKIREGFVSNSSSASYTVNIYENLNDFLSRMHDIWPYGSLVFLEKFYSKEIDKIKQSIKTFEESEMKRTFDVGEMPYSERLKEKLEGTEQKLDRVIEKKGKDWYISLEILEDLFDYCHIDFKYKKHGIKLSYHTLMHNCYGDIANVLKEIVLYYTFELPNRIICEVNHRG